MKVGIDAHMVGGQETGNETYVKGLIEGFAEIRDVNLIAYHVGSPWATSNHHVEFKRLQTGSPFVRLGLELPIRSFGGIDALHMTYGAPLWSAVPIVLTVHDICYATNPEWFSPRDLRVLTTVVPRSIRKAKHVITVSQAARRDIIDRYRVPEEKISTIPNGPGPGANPISPEEAKAELAGLGLNLQRQYILAVGNLQPRKNIVRLLQAFEQLVATHRHDIDLVVVGPKRFRAAEIVESATPNSDRVHFTGYVNDRQLAACYKASTAFVFPTLYEGFGIPALEAMAHGVPVASSNSGGLPEVCGDAAIMFDPRSVDAIVDALHRILSDASLRQRLSAAAIDRAKQFSWQRSAELTLEAYKKVVAHGKVVA
ncbi:MAG: glycosyltransferase family 1 protein [Candidatus Dormibacteria bacterium]